jgi:hypothetical protein
MFIKEEVALERVSDDENLVNMILNISSRSSATISKRLPDELLIPEVIPDDSIPRGIVKPHFSGRKPGGKEYPIELKHIAGILCQTDTIDNVAAALHMNRSSVAENRNGRTTFGKDNPELRARLDESLSIVRDKAMDRLLSSLDLLDDEKIGKANAKDISAISSNMAKVMSSTLPKEQVTVNAQLIVYAPTQSTEDKFDVVDI